jgi:hypothetical protein
VTLYSLADEDHHFWINLLPTIFGTFGSSERLIQMFQIAQCHIPENCNCNTHCCVNLRPCTHWKYNLHCLHKLRKSWRWEPWQWKNQVSPKCYLRTQYFWYLSTWEPWILLMLCCILLVKWLQLIVAVYLSAQHCIQQMGVLSKITCSETCVPSSGLLHSYS